MKTPHLDNEIERLFLLERTNDLSEYGKELITEYKAIKKALSLHSISCCECKNLPKGEVAISSKALTDPNWKGN